MEKKYALVKRNREKDFHTYKVDILPSEAVQTSVAFDMAWKHGVLHHRMCRFVQTHSGTAPRKTYKEEQNLDYNIRSIATTIQTKFK